MGFPFSDYVLLLEQILAGREAIVDCLERQLFSARGKANARNGDRESIADLLNDCFFEPLANAGHLSRLPGQLEGAHLADGFEPAHQDGYSRELDPVELVLRAHHHWDSNRWPGRNGRISYAQSLYTAFILRQLERLSLRIWDDDRPSSIVDCPPSDNGRAAERLRHVQRVLDLLNGGGPSTQLGAGRSAHAIRFVRDARWLIQTAQGPLTRHLTLYFIIADRVSGSFTEAARIEIHKAGAVLAGGHLRSQLRHLSRRTGWAFDDPQLIALTRSSNSMDLALLVRDLVPLLNVYSAACARHDSERLVLADAILQGLSADPELLLTRLDLLASSTVIEGLFIARGEDGYTEMGEVHREYLRQYGELIGRMSEPLLQDSVALVPSPTAYSPFGIVYGFCADLLSNLVLNTLRSSTSADLSLEDMFMSNARLDEERRHANEWEGLPRGEGERAPFEHSTEWAAQLFARVTAALEVRAARPVEPDKSQVRKARLYVVPRGVAIDSLPEGILPAGIPSAQEHCLTSDATRARISGATALPADRLVADRAEGRLLACVASDGSWFGVSKVPLTLFLSQGKNALITDVPAGVIDVLRRACAELLVVIADVRGETGG